MRDVRERLLDMLDAIAPVERYAGRGDTGEAVGLIGSRFGESLSAPADPRPAAWLLDESPQWSARPAPASSRIGAWGSRRDCDPCAAVNAAGLESWREALGRNDLFHSKGLIGPGPLVLRSGAPQIRRHRVSGLRVGDALIALPAFMAGHAAYGTGYLLGCAQGEHRKAKAR